MSSKPRIIKREQVAERERRMRPQVVKKLLLDEKAKLTRRLQDIDKRLQEQEA
jgi:hypothetical protein